MVLRDVSFTLSPGSILIITGANGSGKSTLLRALSGLLPYDGMVMWRGKSIAEDADEYRQNLRYVGHLDAAKPELTVSETLDYWCALSGCLSMSNDPFGISALRDKPVRYLSAGQKRRLALSRLMFGHAPLWLLDEPTAALDADGQKILLDCIARHGASGGVAVIATHQELPLLGAMHYAMPGSAL